MSKPVKEMVVAQYERQFAGLEGAVLVDVRGIDANENNSLRNGLREKAIQVTVVKNSLARKAFAGTDLEAISPALEGPSALVFGGDSVVNVARELIGWAKKVKELDLKGAVLEGEYYEGEAGVKRLSDFPTKEEAQARVVQLVLTPAGNVVGAAKGPGGRLLGIVKEIQERLEKGEEIKKAG